MRNRVTKTLLNSTPHKTKIVFIHLKIVNDKIIWNDESDKSKGYNLKDGRNLYKTKFIHEVSARRGVSKQ